MLVSNRPMSFSRVRWLRSPNAADIFLIFASLAGFLIVIAALGALGFGVGFKIGPIGEDYNWIDMLQRGPGAETARLLWAYDHRNPLSPWWYIAARNLILSFDAGLLVLRYTIAAVLALSSYFLVLAVAGRSARPFALALAVLIVFWMANRFTEQIIWNFQGALAASMLSIAAYARFIAKARRPYHLYALSLVLWFFAFATYTLQSGAVVAIGYLALRQDPTRARDDLVNAPASLVERLGRAVLDVSPYVVLFGLFILIWETTMTPFAEQLPLEFHVASLVRSLKEGFWNSDFAIFYNRVRSVPHPFMFVAAAGLCAGVLFWALQRRESRSAAEVPGVTWGTLVDVLVVFTSLALPTVLLESSSEMFGPGTRWPMIYQVTTPLVRLVIIAALVLLVSRTRWAWGPQLWNGAVALAAGIGALFSLSDNWVQNAIISNETFIRNSMQRLVAEDLAVGRNAPSQVLLMLDQPNRKWWRSSDEVSPVIARVWLRGQDTSFRLVPWFPSLGSQYSWWRIRFGPDSEGIENARVGGGSVPYQQIDILHVSGRTARRVRQLDQQDLVGFDIEWARDKPVVLPDVTATELCPLVWTADHRAFMDGWSVPERDDKGPVRWTISRAAHLKSAGAMFGPFAIARRCGLCRYEPQHRSIAIERKWPPTILPSHIGRRGHRLRGRA